MKEFDVTITEKLQTVVTVQAETAEEAARMVSDQWKAGDHILDAENFTDVDFQANDGRETVIEQESENRKMEVLLVEPGQYPRVVSIGTELKDLQKAVGGSIEAVYPYPDAVALVCDEEGKINGSPLNRAVRNEDGDITDIIAGTFFICGLGEDSFESLPKELQGKYEELFHSPESFLKLGKQIMAFPTEPGKTAAGKDKSDHGKERE